MIRPTTRFPRALVVTAALAAVAAGVLTPAAASADPGVDEISLVDGVTAPVFGYDDAIRERVFIPVAGVDQDLDGTDDVTAIDIIRPRASDAGLKVPAIIDPSPYYTTIGRGNEIELLTDLDGDGLTDRWPMFIDNYFVPRGYAVIYAQMDGTGRSTGCSMHGGPGDIASMRVVVDWLQGRVVGRDAAGAVVTPSWHNGKAAMTGKSYDGALTYGVAATGVQGLTTVVPIDGITDWYRYSRTGGIRHNAHYPATLSNIVTDTTRRSMCAAARTVLSLEDGDASGDINAFWEARNYRAHVGDITASVFAVHGLNDDNVEMDQFADFWAGLAANDVPRKVWLMRVGHVDPFDSRREVWVDTLHRWFDHWLQGVPNGIMDEPRATVETDPDVYEDAADWPLPGTTDVAIRLTGTDAASAGTLLLGAGTGVESLSFTGPSGSISESTAMAAPDTQVATRLAFLSEPLASELRISGTPRIELTASLSTTQANLGVLLVDYGPATRAPREPSEGVWTTFTRTCWGEASDDDAACYLEVARRLGSVETWRLSRGALDSSNRVSLIEGEAIPVTPDTPTAFAFPLEPYDQIIPAGHRIGVIVTTNLSGYHLTGTASPHVTLDTTVSRILLPVVGGLPAAVTSQAFGAAPPVNLSFDVGGHGTAIPPQSVAYDTAPSAPTPPAESGWVFRGWYADAARTTAFDFTATLRADATAYAAWEAIADAVATLEISPSSTTATVGETITVTVTGFDGSGAPLGDVTAFATLTSSVASDQVVGDQVTFVHASPHTLTARLGAADASVVIEVEPAPVVTDPSGSVDPALGGTGVGPIAPVVGVGAALVLLGIWLLVVRRRRARRV